MTEQPLPAIRLVLQDYADETLTQIGFAIRNDIAEMARDHTMTENWHRNRRRVLGTIVDELRRRGQLIVATLLEPFA